jgi:hypothetical protein
MKSLNARDKAGIDFTIDLTASPQHEKRIAGNVQKLIQDNGWKILGLLPLLFVLCLVFCAVAPAMGETKSGTLTVVVQDSKGEPISGALVGTKIYTGELTHQTETDANGSAALVLEYNSELPYGTEYTIWVDALDYMTKETTTYFDGDRMLPITLLPGGNSTPLPFLAMIFSFAIVVLTRRRFI